MIRREIGKPQDESVRDGSYERQGANFSKSDISCIVEGLREFLRFQTVSSQPRYAGEIRRCAAWLANYLRRIGMERTTAIPTAGHPIVYAEWRKAPGASTLLIYGHYDVQPPEPLNEWQSPPFEPTVRGDYLFARGATDDKGQMFAHIKALESCLASYGRLPVNVVCLFEGEEEIGSQNLLRFLAEKGKELRADLAIVSDTTMPAPDRPVIVYALRGNLSLELEVRGQHTELHSGLYGGMVRNPMHALCEILARLHDPDGRIGIPGFYERVRRTRQGEREYMARVGPSDQELLALAGTAQGWGEGDYSLYERTTIRPSINVTGISGGYQGEGAKGVIPARAMAKIDIRMAPFQDPGETAQQFRQHIASIAPPDVSTRISIMSSAKPVEMNPSHPLFRVAEKACRLGFGRAPVYHRSGGTIPVVSAIREQLGIPVILLGYGLADARIQSPNENLYLPNFIRGIATSSHLLTELGRLRMPKRGNRP